METYNLNVEEALDIALKIEINGYAFYKKSAEMFPEHKEWLMDLANQEIAHEKFYENLKKKYVSETHDDVYDANDIEGQAMSYLNAIADTIVFNLTKGPEETFTGKETIEDIIADAMTREKEAILFFTGVKNAIRNSDIKKSLDDIINEEMTHLTWLQDRLVACR